MWRPNRKVICKVGSGPSLDISASTLMWDFSNSKTVQISICSFTALYYILPKPTKTAWTAGLGGQSEETFPLLEVTAAAACVDTVSKTKNWSRWLRWKPCLILHWVWVRLNRSSVWKTTDGLAKVQTNPGRCCRPCWGAKEVNGQLRTEDHGWAISIRTEQAHVVCVI